MDEISREVISKEQKNGSDGMPWKNIEHFANLVYQRSVQAYETSSDSQYCDRSLLDLIAYLKVAEKPIPKELKNFSYQNIFHSLVFFAPTWDDIFCKDAQRLQEQDYCMKLEQALLAEYTHRGFEVIKLPKSSPSERRIFIQNIRYNLD